MEDFWPLTHLVILRCTHLLQLELTTNIDRSQGHKYWDLLFAQETPQYLESLSLDPPICDSKVFSWAAKASGLKHLSIDLSDVPSFLIPPGSFQELRSLRVVSSEANWLTHLWCTSMVSYLTRVTIVVGDEGIGDTEVGPIYALIAANSPLLNEFHNESPSISIDDLHRLRPLPLRSLRMPYAQFVPASQSIFRIIASFWPKLERLDLQDNPITLDDLVCISRYLPELRDLAVNIPAGYLLGAVRPPRLSPAELDAQRAVWLSHSFLLSPGPLYIHYRSSLKEISA